MKVAKIVGKLQPWPRRTCFVLAIIFHSVDYTIRQMSVCLECDKTYKTRTNFKAKRRSVYDFLIFLLANGRRLEIWNQTIVFRRIAQIFL